MKLICELSGEHPDLPFAELDILGHIVDRRSQVAVVETGSPDLAGRLALSHFIMAYLGECDPAIPSLGHLLDELSLEPGMPFAVRVSRKAGSSMTVPVPRLERMIGSKIRGRVCLDRPAVEYRAVFSGDRCYFGRVLFTIDRGSFEHRRPGSRTFFHPGVMMPRVARALVNSSLVREGECLYDPFCGTGGIVLEAVLCGVRGLGSDIDPGMVAGSRRNVPDGDFFCGDMMALPLRSSSVDGVVTDLPYGQSSAIGAESLDALYGEALSEIKRVLLPGKRAVIVTHRDISALAEPLMTVEACFYQRVHRSLTRKILVVRK